MGEDTVPLLTAARQGNREAAARLLNQYRPWLKLIALRRLDGAVAARLDASDLVQQTCLSIVRRLDHIGGEDVEGFLKWLRTVHERNIANTLRDHVTAARRTVAREAAACEEEWVSPAPSPTQRALENEQAVALARALESLPEDQREAIRLRYIEGFRMQQIGERLSRSEDAVVGLIRRGLERLRDILPQEVEGG